MNKLIVILVFFFTFQSCDNKMEKKSNEKEDTITNNNKENPKLKVNLFENIPTKNFPIIDSTNFDNFESFGIPANGILKQIKLETNKENKKNYRINYKIPFSENFTSITFTYQSGDHELFTSIITVNKENKIIDMLEIAYDEIAESAFQKTSKIDKEKITITQWNWMSGEPVTEIETYILQSNGKFRKVK